MNNKGSSDEEIDDTIEKYVPSRIAYITATSVLFLSGISGGLIGYSMMKVFFPDASALVRGIGTCLICAGIIYGVSVITSLGLQASVEWKSRKSTGPEKDRPSRLVRTDNRD